MTLSISLGLLARGGLIDLEKFIALKSIDFVRFLKPVRIGDTIHVSYRSGAVRRKDGKANVVTTASTINQDGEVVMEFQTTHVEKT